MTAERESVPEKVKAVRSGRSRAWTRVEFQPELGDRPYRRPELVEFNDDPPSFSQLLAKVRSGDITANQARELWDRHCAVHSDSFLSRLANAIFDK